ncbi:PotD/PotF family extracellular solute-binding protein [Haloarculaceae archaeon H-GB1-1]|nr:PotD/PotF family extracellular solute-binding protein [Haloarculaceae archaeon H-GB1-1]
MRDSLSPGESSTSSRKVSRRAFIGTGAAIALAGCSGNSGGSQESQSTTVGSADSNELADKVTLYTWGGSYAEARRNSIKKVFEEETGVTVEINEFANDWDAISKQRAGGGDIDVIQPTQNGLYTGISEELILPLREKNFDNLDLLKDKFDPKKASYDPGDGFHHVPVEVGATGTVHNTEQMDRPMEWKDLYTEQTKGKISQPNFGFSGYGAIAIAAIEAGIDITKLNENTDSKMEKVWSRLEEMNDSVFQYYSSNAEMGKMLLNESALGGGYFYARARSYQQEGAPIEYRIPEDGAPLWAGTTAIAKGTERRYTAEKLLDYSLREDVQRLYFEEFPYVPTTKMDPVPEPVKDNHLYHNLDRAKMAHIPTVFENQEQWQRKFQEVIRS